MDDVGIFAQPRKGVVYKLEMLEVWKLSLGYLDGTYALLVELPKNEEYNLKSQLRGSATSVAANIAEGSTGQSDAEQARFHGHAIRSTVESVACTRITERRKYVSNRPLIKAMNQKAKLPTKKLQAMRVSMAPEQPWLRESGADYTVLGADKRGFVRSG